MSSTDKKQTTILVVFSALAIFMTLSPLGLNSNTNMAFAGGNHDDDAGNSASQIIAQVQHSLQNSQVVSGNDIEDSGNNFNFQNQENSGNNAAGQRGGDDNDNDNDDNDDDGNNSNQGIGQSQSSRQNSQCVSGGDTNDSCNNVSFQNQENSGNNAAGQQGGGDGGNNSNQGIGQSQSSRQNSQCVAGGSLSNSCNNVSFQNQENSGNNAAGQQGGGDGGNNSNQGIGQDQNNEQNAQCVSGEDAIVSCNNVSFQNQVNSGFNVLGQD